jgi:hypothetical protein
MFNSLFSRIFIALTSTLYTTTVNDCSAGKSLFTLNSASVSPDVPVSGQNVYITLFYTVPQGMTITDGTSEYSATYNFLPLSKTVEPLCADVPCPLKSGQYTNTSETQWPSGVSGTLSTQMKWFSVEKDLLLCLGVTWKTLSNNTELWKIHHKFMKRVTHH